MDSSLQSGSRCASECVCVRARASMCTCLLFVRVTEYVYVFVCVCVIVCVGARAHVRALVAYYEHLKIYHCKRRNIDILTLGLPVRTKSYNSRREKEKYGKY